MLLPRLPSAVVALDTDGIDAAIAMDGPDGRSHIGLAVPGYAYGDHWTLIEKLAGSDIPHVVERFTDKEDSREGFFSLMERPDHDVVHEGYCVEGKQKTGAPVFAGVDPVTGYMEFAFDFDRSTIFMSPKSAQTTLANIRSKRNYFRADRVDTKSFFVRPAEIRMKQVDIPEDRDDLAELVRSAKGIAPAGWAFCVADRTQTRHDVAENCRMSGVPEIEKTSTSQSLGRALWSMKAIRTFNDGSGKVFLRRRELDIGPTLALDEIAAVAATYEQLPRLEPVVRMEMEDVGTYRPFP